MKNKRTVLLFGAGAMIAWGGPKTSFLTEIIRNSGFYCNDNTTRITEFIFKKLCENNYQGTEINFETIINVVDELIIHYGYFDNTKQLPSFSKVFFSSKFDENILNFSIKGSKKNNFYQLDIPKGKSYDFTKSARNNEAPDQFFLQQLLSELLTVINIHVSKYTYHTEESSVINKEENIKINFEFQKWLNFISKDSIIRMYTLNYDRLFKILAEKIGLNVFEGFDCGEFIPCNGLLPNISRIITDFDSNIYYNLHGSSFWNVYPRDFKTKLLSPNIVLYPYPQLIVNNDENYIFQMETGKNILISNIITGFQKTQKSFITPFKQMQSSFDKDCFLANDLFIIGYSFGDSHINVSIKTALKYNPDLKLHFIDPIYYEKEGKDGYEILKKRLINIFPEILNSKQTQPVYLNNKNTCIYYDGKLTVNAISFNEYINEFNLS